MGYNSLKKMKRIISFAFIVLTIFLGSCSKDPGYIDATYQYKADIQKHGYNIQITLNQQGRARLQMLDEPVIVDLSDLRHLPKLHKEGVYGSYYYVKECDCYCVYPDDEYWYDTSALRFVTGIYLGKDGYIYYTIKTWGKDGYVYVGDEQDVVNHRNRVASYTKRQK